MKNVNWVGFFSPSLRVIEEQERSIKYSMHAIICDFINYYAWRYDGAK